MDSTDKDTPTLRLDKWLWSARLYKTRGLAVEQIKRGRVLLNDQPYVSWCFAA